MTNLFAKSKSRITWLYLDISDKLPNATKDFSWKTRWRMRYDKNPLFVVFLDKYRAKEYAQQRGVRVAETFYVTDDPQTISFHSLPKTYFLKATHGCKWNIYCKNGEFYYYSDGEDIVGHNNFSKYRITQEQALELCKDWLGKIYSKREWAYRHIEPQIMVEKALEQCGGGELIDYRCFTFEGKVKAVYVDSPTASVNLQRRFVDPNWKEFSINNPKAKTSPVLPERPQNFAEIIQTAEKLASDMDFVRVDLYDTTQGIVLGEMSVYHNGGESMLTPDRAFNKWLGDQWTLPDRPFSR